MKTPRFHANRPYADICILVALILSATVFETTTSLSQTFDQAPRAAPRNTSPRPAQKDSLTIASWNLEDAVSSGAILRRKPKRKVWRNTFVPRQRAYAGQTKLNETLSGADIVLLQGVNSIREARKLFPARRWKLVVSRAILKVARGRGPFSRNMPEGFATTAIAVRYQLGVRVTGQQHLLELAKAETAANDSKPRQPNDAAPPSTPISVDGKKNTATEIPVSQKLSTPDATQETNVSPQAGLAVRIFSKGQMIWFVSLALGDTCRRNEKCRSRKVLESWIEDKRDFDIPVVIAGRLFKKASASPKQAHQSAKDPSQKTKPESMSDNARSICANQDIQLDKQLKGTIKNVAKAGCIAVAVIAQ